MDKALVFGTRDCRFESCQDQVFLVPYAGPASLDPMMLLLCEASLCLPSLAWGLTLLLTFCNGKYTWPGSNWRPPACEADVIAARPQVLLLHTSKAHGSACLKNDNRCCCKFTK